MEQQNAKKKILIIVANPSVSTTMGWPAGYWASELTHPYYEFINAGFDVTIASPQGGKVEMDAFSDPLNENRYAADDIVTLGYLHHKGFMDQLVDTPIAGTLSHHDFDAILVAGGQSPMFTFAQETGLQTLFSSFYADGKICAALCHGTALLLYCKGSDGQPIIQGKQITGYTNEEEDYFDQMMGQPVMPFRIEDEAQALGAHFVKSNPFTPFAVRDGALITGQQQHSGRKTGELIIQALLEK